MDSKRIEELEDEIRRLRDALLEMAEKSVTPPLVIMPGSEAEKINNDLRKELGEYKKLFLNIYVRKK